MIREAWCPGRRRVDVRAARRPAGGRPIASWASQAQESEVRHRAGGIEALAEGERIDRARSLILDPLQEKSCQALQGRGPAARAGRCARDPRAAQGSIAAPAQCVSAPGRERGRSVLGEPGLGGRGPAQAERARPVAPGPEATRSEAQRSSRALHATRAWPLGPKKMARKGGLELYKRGTAGT